MSKPSKSPTARTMEMLREQGFECGVVERYNSFTMKRHDLFGIIDLIAINPKEEVYGIQCCGTSFSEHDKKILASDKAIICIRSGIILELWGWRKLKVKRGGKAIRYKPRIKRYSVLDFL